jgi:hypothetical protein
MEKYENNAENIDRFLNMLISQPDEIIMEFII